MLIGFFVAPEDDFFFSAGQQAVLNLKAEKMIFSSLAVRKSAIVGHHISD
jgi:hypothetical protein